MKLAKCPTLDDLASYRLGFFLAGGSGAGKTTSAQFIAEAIANIPLSSEDYSRFIKPEKLEGIALDVHANDPSNARGWDMLGVKAVWEPSAVLKQLDYLEDEYEARKSGKKGNRTLIFFDEYGETYKALRTILLKTDESDAGIKRILTRKSDFIMSLVTGGARKFGMIPIIMNQSWNCKKLRIDASERNNFIGIYLNKLADTYAKNVGITDKEILELLEENKTNYRALVSGACPDSFMLHPSFPGVLLSQTGVPPERTPDFKLYPPSMKVVDWGVRELGNGKVTEGVTDESRQSHDEVTGNRIQRESHELETLLSLDCSDCHPSERFDLVLEYQGEKLFVTQETIEAVLKLKQEGFTKKEIMRKVWGKSWNGDEKSKKVSFIYNKIIEKL